MNLDELNLEPQANEGATLTLLHPITDEPLFNDNGEPMLIHLVGSESTIMNDEIKIRARKKVNKKSKSNNIDEVIESSTNILAVCTIGWQGICENGVDIVFSKENAISLYTRYPWVRQQVDAFICERANFFKI